MAEGRTNAGGGGFNKSVIIVTAPTGSTVTCFKGEVTKTASEKNGTWTFSGLEEGTWTVKATLSGQTATQTVNITQFGVYRIAMSYRATPEFTYTGNCEIVQDDDAAIPDFASWKGNWKIKFLTSGTFTVTNMHGWDGRIDLFLVGGGGGGGGGSNKGIGGKGGGGYYGTYYGIKLSINTAYEINIASGGIGGTWYEGEGRPNSTAGGKTTAFGKTANGGNRGIGASDVNGSNGEGGTQTGEFETAGVKYSGSNETDIPGDANTGKGGGGGHQTSKGQVGQNGGSGIVIIRNAREVA